MDFNNFKKYMRVLEAEIIVLFPPMFSTNQQ